MAIFNKKAPRQAKILFDIADDSVAAAIYTQDKEKPEVIWSKRQAVKFSQHRYTDHFEWAMLQAIKKLTGDVQKDGIPFTRRYGYTPDIEHVHCVFSAAWQVSDTVSSGMQQGKPFLPGKRHIRQLGRDAHRKFNDAKEQDDRSQLSHLSHRILSVAGDGNRLLAGRQTPVRRLDLEVYISKTPSRVKKSVQHILTQLFRSERMQFHSGTELTHNVLADSFKHPVDFLYIAPGRMHTDISITRSGRLVGVGAVPIGEDFLIRTTATALNRPHGEIDSRLSLFHRGKHHVDHGQEIKISLEEIGRRWAARAVEEIHRISDGSLPTHAYLLLPPSFTESTFTDFIAPVVERIPQLRIHVIDDVLFRDFFHNPNTVDHRLALGILGTDRH